VRELTSRMEDRSAKRLATGTGSGGVALPGRRGRRRYGETAIQAILFLCGLVSILTTAGIIWVLISETLLFFRQVPLVRFLTDTQWTPLFTQKHFGILPLLTATLLAAGIAILVALPLGLLAAIWLAEYASSPARRVIKPVLDVLAGIPTVVYGYFALLFVTPLLQKLLPGTSVFNALSAGLVMGIMILPMVASLSEDTMLAVPHSLREAAYALGATRMEVVWRVVLPAALSGLVVAFILAISRAIGETMIVTIAMGQQPNLTLNPLVPMETMTACGRRENQGDARREEFCITGLAVFRGERLLGRRTPVGTGVLSFSRLLSV